MPILIGLNCILNNKSIIVKFFLHLFLGYPWEFFFMVKFFPANPNKLRTETAKHYMALQLQRTLLKDR